uniref:Endonuclease/reverse transcriptase n=1 Tax=Rhipicephalus zambeziensis TaxID=60191 RepID=A0A224YVX5_9ACAR
MIQRKAIRFVYNRYSYFTSPSELLKKADLDTLQARRQHDRLKYMFLLYHDKLRINKDAYIETVHRRSTRSEHPKKLKEYSCKTKAFKNSFFPRTVTNWNALSADLINCATVQSFMANLKHQRPT